METENTASVFMPRMRYEKMHPEMWKLWNHAVGDFLRSCENLEKLKAKDKQGEK